MFINSKIDVEMVQYLDEDGNERKDYDSISNTDLVEMYKWMIKSRVFDQRAIKYQRQGRIGTYAPFQGQEAAQIGSAFALEKNDWIYPSYREGASSFVHGLSMSQSFLYAMGNMKGLSQKKANVFPIQIIIAAQCLHAVGGAWASKYQNESAISVAYVGDGGTSEGDFHEAMNFAGVYKLPIIFFVQNNQWAISVPVSKQTASPTIAQKALAYGIDGIQVDGNDLIAVYLTMQEAIKKARQGEPVLIEAVTYRHGPHTTADDETKYRIAEEDEAWKLKDPIKRIKTHLIKKGIWDEELDKGEYDLAEKMVTEAFERAANLPKTEIQDLFDHVYQKKPTLLKEQQKTVKKGD